MKDELSKLPPWNYYLLFAITCHLSLLTAYSDKNKMTYSNLCICFQPALKIDAFCFSFLVQDWRNCWQGCWTEKEALEEEYRVLRVLEGSGPGDGGLHSSGGDSSSGSNAVADQRSLASSGSANPSIGGRNRQEHSPGRAATAVEERSLASSGGANCSMGGRHQHEQSSSRATDSIDELSVASNGSANYPLRDHALQEPPSDRPAFSVGDRSLKPSSSGKTSLGERAQQGRPPPLSLTTPSEEDFEVLDIGAEHPNRKYAKHLPKLHPVLPLSPLGPLD